MSNSARNPCLPDVVYVSYFLVICSRSLHVVCIFPFEMLTAWKIMFVNIVLSVCLLLEGDMSEKSAYVC